MQMFAPDIVDSAAALVHACRSQGLKIVAAESCSGGLLAAALTEVAGSSDVFERGFITYSNAAKVEMLGVGAAVIERHGAVSAAVAVAMADGALRQSLADISVSVTGIAGPGGGTVQKPVGLVYIAVQRRTDTAAVQRFNFAATSRNDVRVASVREGLRLMSEALK
jgi:nicotinamide-nucleotide amidase